MISYVLLKGGLGPCCIFVLQVVDGDVFGVSIVEHYGVGMSDGCRGGEGSSEIGSYTFAKEGELMLHRLVLLEPLTTYSSLGTCVTVVVSFVAGQIQA